MKKVLSIFMFMLGTLGFVSAQTTTIEHSDGSKTQVSSTKEGHTTTDIDKSGNKSSGGSAGPGENHTNDHRREVERQMGDDSKVGKTNHSDLSPGMSKDKVKEVNDNKDKPKG